MSRSVTGADAANTAQPDVRSLAAAMTEAPLRVHGRLIDSSNSALVVTCEVNGIEVPAIYKPVAGERPLWDFPDGTLAHREVAASILASAMGWDCVPITVWRPDGPAGPGMCQQWIDTADQRQPVEVFRPDEVEPDWLPVVSGVDATGAAVCVAHADTAALRRLCLFDAVVNNADRKAGHILATAAGGLYGIDHGVTFHVQPKLRTVLWGFAGEPVGPQLIAELRSCAQQLGGALGQQLAAHVSGAEVEATIVRIDALVADRSFPTPGGDWPAIPWPVF